jgi:hypothetical protein
MTQCFVRGNVGIGATSHQVERSQLNAADIAC